MFRRSFGFVLCTVLLLPVFAQTGSDEVDLAKLYALYADLRSPDVERRDRAFLMLKNDPAMLRYPDTRERLVEYLEALSARIRTNYLSGKGMPDGWGETIISPLLEILPKLYENQMNARVFKALANSSYNADSQFALWLGRQAAPYLESLLEMLRIPIGADPDTVRYYFPRESAAALMAALLEAQPAAVGKQERAYMLQRIAGAALGDPISTVREEAAAALGRVGDLSHIPILEQIAKGDPASFRGPANEPIYVVRPTALDAIEKIRGRVSGR